MRWVKNWKSEPPKEDGWYWWRMKENCEPEVVRVSGGWCVMHGVAECPLPSGEWYGPMRPPPEHKTRIDFVTTACGPVRYLVQWGPAEKRISCGPIGTAAQAWEQLELVKNEFDPLVIRSGGGRPTVPISPHDLFEAALMELPGIRPEPRPDAEEVKLLVGPVHVVASGIAEGERLKEKLFGERAAAEPDAVASKEKP